MTKNKVLQVNLGWILSVFPIKKNLHTKISSCDEKKVATAAAVSINS